MVPETESQSFRRFEPECVSSEPIAPYSDESTSCPSDARRAAADATGACCTVPWSNRSEAQPFAWHELPGSSALRSVRVVLGKATMARSDVPSSGGRAMMVLDRATDDPVEIVVDGRVIALGRLVVARDNKLAVEVCQVRRSVCGRAA